MKFLVSLTALLVTACSGGGSDFEAPKMLDVVGGTFIMGAPPQADAQQGKPQRRVTVPPFRLGEAEVTFDQFDRFTAATGRPRAQDDGFGRGARPVINVSYGDILAYIEWLNRDSGEGGFRLPSEAEWEYAARAGTTTGFFWGEEPDSRYANTRSNAAPDKFQYTAPVKSFMPNPWGFYDMAGNVWEVIADCYYPDYRDAPTDGSARVEQGCAAHMIRGGDFNSSRRGQRPTAKGAIGSHYRTTSVGFRLAQDMPGN